MAVRKLFYRTETGAPFIGPVIDYDDDYWLVPEWLEGPTIKTWRPARIICLRGLPVENPVHPSEADWALKGPLHTDILSGRRLSRMPRVIPEPADIILHEDHDFHR